MARRDAWPDFAEAPGLRELIETAVYLRDTREGNNVDPIGDALAIVLDEMDQYADDERYTAPDVAARIQRVRTAMEELQLFLDGRVN